jgi:hypothetical protein
VDAVGAAHAEGVLEFEGTALADFADFLHVVDDDVERLRDLVGQSRVAQVAARHAVVHPAGRLLFAFGHVGVDVFGHVGEEGDDVVVGDGLDFVDALDGEVGVVADPLRFLLGDARSRPARLGPRTRGSRFPSRCSNLFSFDQILPISGRV